ncbi:MAG: NAD-dependent dehydratase [Herminiimonas sp.]|nr:NAD-dependent dehydratase [Herminiimonas sp.]
MIKNTALIAGATGQIGNSVLTYLSGQDNVEVIGLSRSPGANRLHPMIGVDLTDAADCRYKLGHLREVTHIIYAARNDHFGGKPESAATNQTMLANLIDVIEACAQDLRHVHLVHGTKYYGHQRWPSPVPYREDLPRGQFENYYFLQQDFVERRQKGRSWNWSISRPHTFCDLSTDQARSITLLIAVYASVLRELGLPLFYPGTRESFRAKTQFTWLPLLAKAIDWMSTDSRCANQAYNIVNGDAWSWEQLWPLFASYFQMDVAGPRPGSLNDFMADKENIWQQLVARHGLQPTGLHSLVQWPYGDYVFSIQWDVVSDMAKARRDGFADQNDSKKMWVDSFDFFRRQKLIP